MSRIRRYSARSRAFASTRSAVNLEADAVLAGLDAQAQGEHLGAVGEAEGGAARADGGLGRVGHGVQCSAGWTISVRTPPDAAGWRNATREPRIPVRGVSSISRTPRSRSCASAAS